MFMTVSPKILEQVWTLRWLNDEVEERREEREGRWTVSLQSAYAPELKKLMREISGSYINSEGLNHYINELRENYK